MHTIKIGFSTPKKKTLFSKTIMFIEQTNYSHVYIRLYSTKYKRDLIYQASGLAVNFMGFDYFLEHNNIVDEMAFDISDEAYIRLMQFAIDNVGKPYGIKQIFGMGIRKILKWFGINWANKWADGNQTYICSELAAHIIKDYISGSIGSNLDDIDPKDIYEHLSMIKRSIRPTN